MLKYTDYDIVFQEVPDEVTLVLTISRCPFRCPGCHSKYLRLDVGELLTKDKLDELVTRYRSGITCVCFMGGDSDVELAIELLQFVKETHDLKTAWYSGKDDIKDFDKLGIDYIKIGSYKEKLGGLSKRTTNQRMYRISKENNKILDITSKFWK